MLESFELKISSAATSLHNCKVPFLKRHLLTRNQFQTTIISTKLRPQTIMCTSQENRPQQEAEDVPPSKLAAFNCLMFQLFLSGPRQIQIAPDLES